ncbi:hypothetical protein COLO4_21669 [Corchorus olitorius]|uniref:Uncharacterized protein n=1 Tax=Corchorus olitorius TaxID=93759 RepID=A0A1R3IRT4_9ROSI|nr:hypothetical protein COLO4_21669 [Corchorus olitorius]
MIAIPRKCLVVGFCIERLQFMSRAFTEDEEDLKRVVALEKILKSVGRGKRQKTAPEIQGENAEHVDPLEENLRRRAIEDAPNLYGEAYEDERGYQSPVYLSDDHHSLVGSLRIQSMTMHNGENPGANVHLKKCIKEKEKIMENVAVNFKQEFKELWDYAEELRSKNPGSTIKDLELGVGDGFTFMSDKQKLLLRADSQEFSIGTVPGMFFPIGEGEGFPRPMSLHTGTLSGQPYQENGMIDLRSLIELIIRKKKELMKKKPKHWTRAFQNEVCKSKMVDSNACESFNSILLDARTKSIITMLEHIREETMKRILAKRKFVEKWKDNYGPLIKNFDQRKKDSGGWELRDFAENGVEVKKGRDIGRPPKDKGIFGNQAPDAVDTGDHAAKRRGRPKTSGEYWPDKRNQASSSTSQAIGSSNTARKSTMTTNTKRKSDDANPIGTQESVKNKK